MKRKNRFVIWPAVVVLVLDQLSKLAVLETLRQHETVLVIQGFFNLVLARNRGMAFGILNRPHDGLGFYLLVAATLAAVIILIYWLHHLEENEVRVSFGLGLILGGALGNLVDRVRLGSVVDFLDFHLGAYHWPAFNLADSAITIGTIWVALHLILQARTRKTG